MCSIVKARNKLLLALLVISVIIICVMLLIYIRVSNRTNKHLEMLNAFVDEDDYSLIDSEYFAEQFKLKNDRRLKQLRKTLWEMNKDQRIHYKYENSTFKATNFIIVIQVPYSIEILILQAHLISLKNSLGISNSLLIFSHDSYNIEINELINKMGFVMYTQIYYPYNTQIFPKTFPGPDDQLCTNDFKCVRSKSRRANLVQRKHFWWWQMNYVFNKLNVTKTYNKNIIFLESNYYALRDFIIVAELMEFSMKKKCPECEVISLGENDLDVTQYDIANNVNLTISTWDFNISRAGIGFNRTVWNKIKSYSHIFCHHNDYEWDASLRYLGSRKDTGQFNVLVIDAPRMIKLDDRLFDDETFEHTIEEMLTKLTYANNIIVRSRLYARNICVKKSKIREVEEEIKLGEWEDDRDKSLCMYFVDS